MSTYPSKPCSSGTYACTDRAKGYAHSPIEQVPQLYIECSLHGRIWMKEVILVSLVVTKSDLHLG